MIVYLKDVRKLPGPYLIAAPLTVLPNWRAELQRWAPGLRVIEYRGSPDVRTNLWTQEVRACCMPC